MTRGPGTESYDIVPATKGDWEEMVALLEASHLPLDGLEPHVTSAMVARDRTALVGCVALELYGPDALLRSVAVAPDSRKTGVGLALTAAAIGLARKNGVRAIWLLTETASGFFPRFGFQTSTREVVPPAVRQSVEFTTACPASATVMVLRLEADPG